MQIHSAAERGDLDAVRYCLERGVPVNQAGTFGMTPLLAAVNVRRTSSARAMLEISRTLLEAGADPNARDEFDNTALMLAVRNESLEAIRLILKHGADPNAVDRYGGTALQRAISNHSLSQVQLLVQHGADPNLQTSETALFACFLRWDDELTEVRDYLLANGMQDSAIGPASIPIEDLLNSNKPAVLKRALDAQSDVRPKSWNIVHETLVRGSAADLLALKPRQEDLQQSVGRYDYTPFLLAVAIGDREKAGILLELGSSLRDAGWAGRSAFHVAIESGQTLMVPWLIERGLPVDFHPEGDSPLMAACEMNCAEAVEVLLQHGASATEPGEFGRPIHKAKSLEVTRFLVERGGADINEVDPCGYWPLKNAAFAGDCAWVEWLLDHGAEIELTSTGETALHSAVFVDALDVTRLLLERGANPNVRDVDDDTPLHNVRSREMVQLLRSFGADPENCTSLSGPPRNQVEDPLIKELL